VCQLGPYGEEDGQRERGSKQPGRINLERNVKVLTLAHKAIFEEKKESWEEGGGGKSRIAKLRMFPGMPQETKRIDQIM